MCEALNRQLLMQLAVIQYLTGDEQIHFEDLTLECLVDPSYHAVREDWNSRLTTWLDRSAELIENNPDIQPVRNKAFALKEALLAENYSTIEELYPGLI
jgi:hypothetical protein